MKGMIAEYQMQKFHLAKHVTKFIASEPMQLPSGIWKGGNYNLEDYLDDEKMKLSNQAILTYIEKSEIKNEMMLLGVCSTPWPTLTWVVLAMISTFGTDRLVLQIIHIGS